jgi:XTP/dITP diphosphohydrolase
MANLQDSGGGPARMKELVVATGNMGKYGEIVQILSPYVESIYCIRDFPGCEPGVEDGTTFEQNALKKAQTAAFSTGKPVLADDSGLVVDALDGKPGVFSARFAGENSTDEENNVKLLSELQGVPYEKRTARFCCVIALCRPDGTCATFTGQLEGTILTAPSGTQGFGYDPLFFIQGYGKTLAELPSIVKNQISHRGAAMAKVVSFLLER